MKVSPPDRRRVRQHRGLDARRPRAPLVTRTLLALAVALLGGAAFLAASGGIGPALATLGDGFEAALNRLVATPVPTGASFPPTDSPRIALPAQPFTSEKVVELEITVPADSVGDPAAKVRVYLALQGLDPAPVVEVGVGTTSRLAVQIELTEGRNDISATLVRSPTDESEHSPIVTWILDLDPPKLRIASPQNNANIETPEATITGVTQGGTTLVARNTANGASISTVAARDGAFEFQLPLEQGENEIVLTGTDPAGNQNTKNLTLVQGSTEMRVNLRASVYTISVKRHPSSLQLVVVVEDPTRDPLAGATAFFTLQIPGLAPISNELITGVDGRATFTTPLIGELSTGGGVGTVLVSHETFGEATDRVTLTFVK